jgi:D-lactate dehydrogenase (cytochrome)
MADIKSAVAALKSAFGDQISTATAVLEHHGTDEAYYPMTPPDAVAFPRSTDDVSRMVKICAEHGCPIVPWGVGTSLEGHALPIKGGVTLDMAGMAALVTVYDADLCAVVQPGITREALNEELRATGLFFPVDPGANATIGGMTATRASGTTAVRYGTMKENVLAMEVVLADGRIIRTGTRAKKSSAGLDLTKVFVGSEGTLGIITELTLRLQGQPEAIGAASCDFASVDDAVNAVIMAVQMGIPVARMELVDAPSMAAINAYSGLDYAQKPHLFMEFHGSEVGVKDQSSSMADIVAEFGGGDFEWSTRAEDRSKIWKARHNAYYACKARKPGYLGFTTDICVPISELAKAISDTQADCDETGLEGTILGHVGDGNYHALFLLEPGNDADLAMAKGLAHRMAERALAVGGTVTGEHGIGIGKMKYMAEEHGDALGVMIDIKRALDPLGIMNPGKMLPMN